MDRHQDWLAVLLVLAGLAGFSVVSRPAPQPPAAGAPPAGSSPAAPPAATAAADATVAVTPPGGRLADALPALRLIAEHLGVAAAAAPGPEVDAARLLHESREQARRRDVHVRFLVATLPDYVDGTGGWDTDQRIEALQRAAAAAGFESDRFHLPDWDPEAARKSQEPRRRHEAEPGALLFRAYPWRALADALPPGVSPQPANELLVVLLVTETATLGVHQDALVSALSLATAWDPCEPLRVIGPSFSGSSLSLRAALEAGVTRGVGPCPPGRDGEPPVAASVHVISGSATSAGNTARLARPLDAGCGDDCPRVEFHSMTASDDDHLCAIQEYLAATDPAWDSGRGIAILAEANTSYGSQLVRKEHADDAAPAASRRCPSRFAEAHVFPFPAHISRLRVQAAAARARDPGRATDALVRLRLEESASTDRVPSLEPELTSAMAEVALESILNGLDRLGVGAVAIFATDKRDHLFLAQEISRRVPGVLLFALEGNLIYLHPDYRAYTRGTLVVGSYPLFFPTQDAVRKHQFTSMAAAGVYNALLAHLSSPTRRLTRPTAGGGSAEIEVRPAVLDYLVDYDDCSEATGTCGPSVWIGMVGRNALWPVHRVSRHALADRRESRARSLERGLAGAAVQPDRARIERDARQERESAARNLAYSWPRPLAGAPGTGGARGAGTADRPRAQRFALPRSATLAGLLVFGAAAYLSAPLLLHPWLPRDPRSPGARRGLVRTRWALDLLHPPRTRLQPTAATPFSEETARALEREYGLGLLACLSATFFAGAWLLVAAVAFYGPPAAYWWRLLEALFFFAGVAVSAVACWSLQLVRPLAGDRPALVRRVLVGIPVLATLVLLGLSMPSARLTGPLPSLNGLRFLSLSSLVSPTVPVLCLAAAVTVWGLWRLRQIQLQCPPLRPDSPLAALVWSSHRAGSAGVVRVLNDPYLRVGARGLALAALPVVLAAALGLRFRFTGEGDASFGWFLCSGAVLVMVLASFTLAHSLRIGRLLIGGLRALERHPLRLAFGIIQRHGLAGRYSLSPPRPYALAPIVRQVRALACAIGSEPAPAAAGTPGAAEPALAAATGLPALARSCEEIACEPSDFRLPVSYHASALWPRLEALSGQLVDVLEGGPWASRPYPPDGPPKPDRPSWHGEAETLLALQAACLLRLVLARVLSGFTVVVAALVLLLCAHLFYNFQGRPFWLALDASLIALATVAVVGQLARLEKDPILSRLWGTSPGRINLTGGLSPRMVAYTLVAVLTMFATFFPEVGSTVAGWVEPVRRSLP